MAQIYVFKAGCEGKMKKVTIFDVAKYFLSRVDTNAGGSMTHLKLQKLCYYAQAWHLVFENATMVDEEFQAWMHGPACPDLWHRYKNFGWQDIEQVASINLNLFTKEQLETLEAVWDAYGQFDGKYLERLTHQEPPWVLARNGCDPGDHCSNIITPDSMKEYYSGLIG